MSDFGLTSEARNGVNAALKAVSTWRNEIVATNQKNTRRVIEEMAVAASALGWPEQVVTAARIQLQSAADIQVRTMDQVMDVSEEQVKLPNPMTASPWAMLSKSLSGLGTSAATNPLELWMQLAKQWRRAWTDTMGLWGKHH
jgi:ribonuclease D